MCLVATGQLNLLLNMDDCKLLVSLYKQYVHEIKEYRSENHH